MPDYQRHLPHWRVIICGLASGRNAAGPRAGSDLRDAGARSIRVPMMCVPNPTDRNRKAGAIRARPRETSF